MRSIERFGLIPTAFAVLVGSSGLEPPTSRLSGARSNHLSYKPLLCVDSFPSSLPVLPFGAGHCPVGGDDGIRTHDPLLAGQVLSQLSYTPIPRALSFQGSFRSLKIEQQKIGT